MSERDLLDAIRLAASRIGAKLFRNNIGAYEDATGRLVKYGVCNPGGSDLIGWLPVTITPNMVGTTLARFVAIEAKTGRLKTTDAQATFLGAVEAGGGVAIVARNVGDVLLGMPHCTATEIPAPGGQGGDGEGPKTPHKPGRST